MNEIKCPNCGTIFQIDEQDYQSIVKQVRDQEFTKEVFEREKQYKQDKEISIRLAEAKMEKEFTEQLKKKEFEISELKNEVKNKEKDTENKIEKKYSEELNKKTIEISELKSEIKLKQKEQEVILKDTLAEKMQEIDSLNTKLESSKNEFLLRIQALRDSYEEKMKSKDEQIAYYKDFKARQSTKMVGESLEQHCYNEFNKLRPLFGDVYFEKDNDAKTGSKGDFIFREYDNHMEVLSIMFEMKNEADETATKHKNEDFLKELDKDRKEKNCEYAVLVSLLELDTIILEL